MKIILAPDSFKGTLEAEEVFVSLLKPAVQTLCFIIIMIK